MIKYRTYVNIFCGRCEKPMKVRKDTIKSDKHLCLPCSKKENWENPEYRKKCSDSHKGIPNYGRRLPEGESNLNGLYYSYKKSAEKRGILFDISKEDFKILTKKNCYYCGREPSQIRDEKHPEMYNGFWVHNGIDRLNDDLDYTFDNIVPCCKQCNYAKQGLSESEFLSMINAIYHNKILKDSNGSYNEFSK